MVGITDIHPLTDFQRQTRAHIERLRATGRPEVLTVNGRPELVIQDAAAYEKQMAALRELAGLGGDGAPSSALTPAQIVTQFEEIQDGSRMGGLSVKKARELGRR